MDGEAWKLEERDQKMKHGQQSGVTWCDARLHALRTSEIRVMRRLSLMRPFPPTTENFSSRAHDNNLLLFSLWRLSTFSRSQPYLILVERGNTIIMAIHPSKKATNHNRNEAAAAPPYRRRTVVGLEEFAHRHKADGKAISAFRERKERKRRHTAQALRKYQKVMHAQGYEPGRGASRKRTAETTAEDSNRQTQEPPKNDDDDNRNNHNPPTTHKRHHKTTPFLKDIQKAQKQKEAAQSTMVDRETREQQRQQKLRDRRQRTKLLRQRTARGQPVMKNLVHDILHKLEKEKQQQQRG